MSARRALLRQLLWSLGGSVGGGALAFATQFGSAYVLDPAGYGQFALIGVALNIAMVTSMWTATGAIRYGSRELETSGGLDRTFSARLWLTVPCVLAGVALLVWAPGWLVTFFRLPPQALRLVALPLVALAVFEHFGTMCLALLRFRLHGLATVLSRVPPLLLVFGAIATRRQMPLVWLVMATGAGYLLGAVAMLPSLGVAPLRAHRPERARMSELLAYSGPQAVALAANTVVFSAGPIFLRVLASMDAVGRYQIANMLNNITGLVAASVNRVLLPYFSRLEVSPEGRKRLTDFLTVFSPLGGFVLALLLGGTAMIVGSLFSLAVPASYAASATVVPIVIVTAAFRLASCIPSQYGQAIGATRTLAVISVAQAVTNLLLTWLLATHTVPLTAPAVALALSEWLGVQLAVGFFLRRTVVARWAAFILAPAALPAFVAIGLVQVSLPRMVLWFVLCFVSLGLARRLLGLPAAQVAEVTRLLPSRLRRLIA